MQLDLIRQLKFRALTYGTMGALMILIGFKLMGGALGFCFVPVVIGGLAYLFLTRAFGNLLAANNLSHEQMQEFQRAFQQQFARHNLPRQIFWLLFAVAEADGATEAEERELVRRFLLERFTDPATAADLRGWEAQRIPPEQVGALALGLGRILSPSERETVFSWCCLVAFADNSFGPDEHVVLQTIARSFGLPSHHARRIFHYAKSVHVRGEQHSHRGFHSEGGASDGEYGRGESARGGSRARGAVTGRGDALRILGLDENANRDQIKKRHRELVREFHPDKHQHLGEVAAKEAEERFRQVQAAYEVLVG
jgi:DnaJ-domain-containing protein 1